MPNRKTKPARGSNGAVAASYDEVLAKLPRKRRVAIEGRTEALMAEILSLKDMRKAMALTQTRMAKALKTTQNQISRLEQRSDLLLSTLRSYVEAMGGELDLVARFPGRPPVAISGLDAVRAGRG